jgi:hypothetical protein
MRENLDKAISFDQKGTSTYSLQLSRHVSTKWLTVASPYIPDAAVPAPYMGFVQVKGSQSFLLKGLGDGLGHTNLLGNFLGQWGCTRIWKKKQEPFKQCKSPKMAT